MASMLTVGSQTTHDAQPSAWAAKTTSVGHIVIVSVGIVIQLDPQIA